MVVFCHEISAKLEFLVSFQNVVVLWDGYVKCGSFLSITPLMEKGEASRTRSTAAARSAAMGFGSYGAVQAAGRHTRLMK